MKLGNDKYTVTITVEVMPSLRDFDIVHNTENINTYKDVYMARVLRIEQTNGDILNVALVDTVCSGYEPHAVLSDKILTVILFCGIVRIDLASGLIVQYVECDNMGGLFEIHLIEGGYIIWGEGEIFRYDLDLKRIWRFSGRDILVSQTNMKSFWIEKKQIHCYDWEGWHYILDLNGNLISEFIRTNDSETSKSYIQNR